MQIYYTLNIDYFLFGVESNSQLNEIFTTELCDGDLLNMKLALSNDFKPNIYSALDPKHWNSIKYWPFQKEGTLSFYGIWTKSVSMKNTWAH